MLTPEDAEQIIRDGREAVAAAHANGAAPSTAGLELVADKLALFEAAVWSRV